MDYLDRLKDFYGYKVITIKYNDNIIGSVPAILMINFDIYDSVKEFDDIITIPSFLIPNQNDVIMIVQNFEKILKHDIVAYNLQDIINIISILEFLQYDKKLLKLLIKKIKSNNNSNNLLIIALELHEKINKIYFNKRISINITPNDSNIDELIKYYQILEDNNPDHQNAEKHYCNNDTIYLKIIKVFKGKRKELFDIKYKAGCQSIYNILFHDLNVEYQNDWKEMNPLSPIKNLYCFNMNKLKYYIDYPCAVKSYHNGTFFEIHKFDDSSYRHDFGYIIDKMNNKHYQVYGGKSRKYYNPCDPPVEEYYSIYIPGKYFTDDYILVTRL